MNSKKPEDIAQEREFEMQVGSGFSGIVRRDIAGAMSEMKRYFDEKFNCLMAKIEESRRKSVADISKASAIDMEKKVDIIQWVKSELLSIGVDIPVGIRDALDSLVPCSLKDFEKGVKGIISRQVADKNARHNFFKRLDRKVKNVNA